ncbi:MAG: hypothetical protein ChlgKO_03230 [Chlamydiales bacterium]
MQLVNLKQRCPHCFRIGYPCLYCRKNPTPWTRRAALFEAAGPGKSLQLSLRYPGVLELIASLMVVQLEKLQWPMPNEITYQPYTLFERIEKGPDLTPELVKILKKKLRLQKNSDPVILVITTDNRKVQTEKLLHRFPKELLRLDITTRHLDLTR